MNTFEAARVLHKNGESQAALHLLDRLWAGAELEDSLEFSVFCAGAEILVQKDPVGVCELLENVILGEGTYKSFWYKRDLSQQAVLYDWLGQIYFKLGDKSRAYESLTRAASLGRDSSLMWRLLSQLCAENRELDLSVRYAKRSLFLYRQLDLELVSGREFPLGFFGGAHPLGFKMGVFEFLNLLLVLTKEASNQKNLKGVRDFVMELMHQFPREPRLPQIRNLIEGTYVQNSVSYRPIIRDLRVGVSLGQRE